MEAGSRREFIWRVTIAVAIAALAFIAFLAIDVLLLVFGGILLSVFLRALSDPLAARSPLSERVSLSVVLIALLLLVGGGSWLVAPELADQFEQLGDVLPEAIDDVREYLEGTSAGRLLLGAFEDGGDGDTLGRLTGLLSGLAEGLIYLLTVLFVGLFVAFNPRMYARGVVALVPADHRESASDLIATLGHTMRWWLIGRALAMLMVGVSTYVILLIMGIPLAGLLGFIVGLLTFIPYLGPILGTIPIALVALMEGPSEALYVILLYAVVQHIEGYVIDPLIQERVVRLPPALTVAAQVMMGLLLGGLGIAMATPLAAVLMVTVKKTYVERTP